MPESSIMPAATERVIDAPTQRVIDASIRLLAQKGPAGIKARSVATEAGVSTMVVYHHFGGIPELIAAVVDHGFRELGARFAALPVTADPIADLFTIALTTREVAQENPHLYDLMFGLSMRSTYRPPTTSDAHLSGRSSQFRDAYRHNIAACTRLVDSGRIGPHRPKDVAAQLWTMVHGFVSLELADHFAMFKDPSREILQQMGINLAVGLGDERDRSVRSHARAMRSFIANTQ